MASILTDALPLLVELAPLFAPRTHRRFQVLLGAAILTTGRRTLRNLLRTVRGIATGNPSSYHRVLSQSRWSGRRERGGWPRTPQGELAMVHGGSS